MGILVDIFGASIVWGILADAGATWEACLGLVAFCVALVNFLVMIFTPAEE